MVYYYILSKACVSLPVILSRCMQRTNNISPEAVSSLQDYRPPRPQPLIGTNSSIRKRLTVGLIESLTRQVVVLHTCVCNQTCASRLSELYGRRLPSTHSVLNSIFARAGSAWTHFHIRGILPGLCPWGGSFSFGLHEHYSNRSI